MITPRLTVRAAQPVIAGLTALGHPTSRILEGTGITPKVLAEPEGRLPERAMGALWARASEVTGDPLLGLHVAMACPVGDFGLHGYAVLSSPTLREAYRRAVRYQHLLHDSNQLVFNEDDGSGELSHCRQDGSPVGPHPAEFLVASWVRLGRLATGTAWTPAEVRFAHPAHAGGGELAAVLGTRPRFETGRTAMRIPATVLDTLNPRSDPALVALLDQFSATLFERNPPLTTTAARVRAWLIESHDEGRPVATEAARALAMSVRTLHRRLRAEGTSFRDLLDGFRRDRAVALLETGRHGVSEVAFVLGFSELSAFHRAFRRWTGRSPAAVRNARVGEGLTD